jgi:predicted RNase H-like nuclease (RuvC/YqgF family)
MNETEYLERQVKALKAENELLHDSAVKATKDNLKLRQRLELLGHQADRLRRLHQIDREIRAMKERLAWN